MEIELDLQVVSPGRQYGVFQAKGDPNDAAWLRGHLRSWLEAEHWHENTWNKFEIRAFRRGSYHVINKVRAV